MTAGIIHLDTSFLIRALVPGTAEDAAPRDWLEEDRGIAMNAVAWTGFLCGPVNAKELLFSTSLISDPLAGPRRSQPPIPGISNASGNSASRYCERPSRVQTERYCATVPGFFSFTMRIV